MDFCQDGMVAISLICLYMVSRSEQDRNFRIIGSDIKMTLKPFKCGYCHRNQHDRCRMNCECHSPNVLPKGQGEEACLTFAKDINTTDKGNSDVSSSSINKDDFTAIMHRIGDYRIECQCGKRIVFSNWIEKHNNAIRQQTAQEIFKELDNAFKDYRFEDYPKIKQKYLGGKE